VACGHGKAVAGQRRGPGWFGGTGSCPMKSGRRRGPHQNTLRQ
jgi:hypothetical protein